jgi:hypothetical protein
MLKIRQHPMVYELLDDLRERILSRYEAQISDAFREQCMPSPPPGRSDPSPLNRLQKGGDLLWAQNHRNRFGSARIGNALGDVLASRCDAIKKRSDDTTWLSVAQATPRDIK